MSESSSNSSAAAPGPAVRTKRRSRTKLLPQGSDWSFEDLELYDRAIAHIAHDDFRLDTYPNQIEVIRSDQMLDAYASHGLPVNYVHWSHGKRFLANEGAYRTGQRGLAYEIVINSNPCIAYLMEENSLPMQALVIAHASYGHNAFFKGNNLFQKWTHADSIIEYMLFAKSYIAQCEERYGVDAVETLLDACHALADLGVDRYKRPAKKSLAQEKARAEERAIEAQMQVNELWRTLPRMIETAQTELERRFPPEPQENLLYFLEKHAPLLAPWEREVVRMVRKISQYFFPQRQTKVMNEGYATFWHYTILNEMRARGLVGDGFMLEVLHSHTSVVYQPGHERAGPYMNPYALGFAIFRDIRRICESPTAEDRAWFPEIAGADWIDTVHFAMRHFRDESFIQQFLSPKVIRDFRLFLVEDDPGQPNLRVAAIHDDAGYRAVRSALARQYSLAEQDPNIQVVSVDVAGDRSLTLEHFRNQDRPLTAEALEVMKHLSQLWGFDVKLRMSDPDGSLVEERVVQITPDMRRMTSGRGLAQLRTR